MFNNWPFRLEMSIAGKFPLPAYESLTLLILLLLIWMVWKLVKIIKQWKRKRDLLYYWKWKKKSKKDKEVFFIID
ncbi:MAG: hypothetical protein I3270_00240 [Candidatus Moeniiplasma glomeromycotorum]|nr:hypothetical protein [Candidatus Moeniiplasma glomeromycotorum]MCE8162269.1 hypothetical protein [Candidatus Moeniiplasma glomeromycotorum]MCE8166074.1 hypothetical protein [Candidatus Moeniiplasma glomeromycotorum]MCE8166668.1 hypothetical protein [Candidatus Moeniiplasma glomeromycotorum]